MESAGIVPTPLTARFTRMSPERTATVLTGVGVLIGVWRMVGGVRRDLANRIGAVDRHVDAVNTRIDTLTTRRR